MEDELFGGDCFFGGQPDRMPLVQGSEHKSSGKARATFEDAKVRMVMRIERCGREEAERIIAARAAEWRAQEKERHDAGDSGSPRW